MRRMGRYHSMADTDLTEKVIIKKNASIQDIMKVIMDTYEKGKPQTVNYARKFDFTKKSGFRALWQDIKRHVIYKEDETGFEVVKGPSALYEIGIGDCKSFTVAGGCTMYNGGVEKFIFRLCHYGNPNRGHIYPIAYLDGEEIIMDSVYDYFNEEAPGKKWWMDYDPETQTVIQEVGVAGFDRNQIFEILKNAALVYGGVQLVQHQSIFARIIGGWAIYNFGKKLFNRLSL